MERSMEVLQGSNTGSRGLRGHAVWEGRGIEAYESARTDIGRADGLC